MHGLVKRDKTKQKKHEINVDDIASKAKRDVEEAVDVETLREIEERTGKWKRIVAEVTGKRDDINKLADPMVKAAVKGGRMLTKMLKSGERKGEGRPKLSHSAIVFPGLKQLGFSLSRASRWQLAGLVNDRTIEDIHRSCLATDDALWSLSPLVTEGKLIAIQNRRDDYDRRASKGQKVSDLRDLIKAGKKFNVIYADPPWDVVTYSEKGQQKSAQRHYRTMTMAQMKKLPVEKLADEDCVLLMWVVSPMLPEALDLIKAWGFTYKTLGFNWVKLARKGIRPFVGLGFWTRAGSELCFLATRGNPKRVANDVMQVVSAPVGAHSAKPDEVHVRIQRLLLGDYLELFARRARSGWWTWGNELTRPDIQEAAE